MAPNPNFWQDSISSSIPSNTAEREMRSHGSDLLVAALENEGVERIFGLPGEENLAVVESLRTRVVRRPLAIVIHYPRRHAHVLHDRRVLLHVFQ